MFEDDTLPPVLRSPGLVHGVTRPLETLFAFPPHRGFDSLDGFPAGRQTIRVSSNDVWFWVFRLSFCHSLALMKLLCSPFPSLPPFFWVHDFPIAGDHLYLIVHDPTVPLFFIFFIKPFFPHGNLLHFYHRLCLGQAFSHRKTCCEDPVCLGVGVFASVG